MCPLPRATMAGKKALVVQNSARVLTLKVRSMCSSESSSSGLPLTTPALFTRMSTGPWAARTSAAQAETCSRSPTSQAKARTGPAPQAAASAATALAPASSRSRMATAAPISAHLRTRRRPMPEAPPVMSTCLLLIVVTASLRPWSLDDRRVLEQLHGGAHERRVLLVAQEGRRVDGQQALHRHRLRLGELDEALAAVAPPEARLLEPAHGACRGPRGRVGLVDIHRARLHARGQFAAETRVARPDARVEAVARVVGAVDHLLDRVAAVDGRDGAEGLGAAQVHLVGDAGQQRGLEEGRAEVGAGLAARQRLGALADGVDDVALDLRELVGADQGTHVLEEGQARAEPHGAERLREPRREHVVHGGVHVHALDADAELAAVRGDAAHRARHGPPQARIGQHQQGVLAAELHRAVLEPLGGHGRDLAAGRRRPGEHEVVGAVHERLAEFGADYLMFTHLTLPTI